MKITVSQQDLLFSSTQFHLSLLPVNEALGLWTT